VCAIGAISSAALAAHRNLLDRCERRVILRSSAAGTAYESPARKCRVTNVNEERVPQGRHLAKDLGWVIRNARFPQQRHEFVFERALGVMFGLVLDVMPDRIDI